MSKWRAEAIRLFPEYKRGSSSFQRSDVTIYQIFFDLLDELDTRIKSEDWIWMDRVFEYV